MLSQRLLLVLCLLFAVVTSEYGNGMLKFDPYGRLQQLELAQRIVRRQGGPICAMMTNNSTSIMLVAKRAQRRSALEMSDMPKVFVLNGETLLALSGVLPEGQSVVALARQLQLKHRQIFQCALPVDRLAEQLSRIFHRSMMDGGQRPPAVHVVLCGLDADRRCSICTVMCDGSFHSWKAVAVGKDSEAIMQVLSEIEETATRGPADASSQFQDKILIPFFATHLHTGKDTESGDNVCGDGDSVGDKEKRSKVCCEVEDSSSEYDVEVS
jgi:20S proteasome alpha/beta subunit